MGYCWKLGRSVCILILERRCPIRCKLFDSSKSKPATVSEAAVLALHLLKGAIAEHRRIADPVAFLKTNDWLDHLIGQPRKPNIDAVAATTVDAQVKCFGAQPRLAVAQ